VRVQYLGKSGEFTARLKQLGKLPAEERKAAGQAINQAKQQLQRRIEERKAALERPNSSSVWPPSVSTSRCRAAMQSAVGCIR
jgi:phenylalanyl-tRNA synthetase alpha subunit